MSSTRLSIASDELVAKRLAARDQGVIEELYAEFGRTTFGYLVRMLGNRATAEDIQQQVFLEVWTRGINYDPQRAGILTWIMQITRSRAIDHLRKRIPEPFDPQVNEATNSSVSLEPSTDELHNQWYVAHYLERLPQEESQLLKMRFVEDKSQSEIADETGIALGTVKMRMVQGLKRLREMMEADGVNGSIDY